MGLARWTTARRPTAGAGATLPEPSCVEHTPHDVACLHELFERRRRNKSSDRPAVIRGSRALSYRELDERANQVAIPRLQGVETGDLVALYPPIGRPPRRGPAAGLFEGRGGLRPPSTPSTRRNGSRFILEHARASRGVDGGKLS